MYVISIRNRGIQGKEQAMIIRMISIILVVYFTLFAQKEDAFGTEKEQKSSGLLDPTRFTIKNSVSFGMASNSGVSGIQSQSLYSTMMQYQFIAPVTLNLNFSMPIHSTFSASHNLSTNNLQSLDYFKSMPFEMSLSWQPTQNMFLRFSIAKSALGNYFYSYHDMHQPWNPFYRFYDEP